MPESDVRPWERFTDFLAESTRIFRGFSMALDAKKLAFALAGVIVWALGAMLIHALIGHPWVLLVAAGGVATAVLLVFMARSTTETFTKNTIIAAAAVLVAIWAVVAILWLTAAEWRGLFGVIQMIWALAVASLFGTAVARIAALNATADETIGPRETTRFALRKFSTAIWTLIVPIAAVIAYGILLIVLSLPGRIPAVGTVWYIAIGALYIVFLLGGLFFAAVLLVYIPSLLLFQPAIATEGNDSFDAVSRAYSYVFGRPWRLLFYTAEAYIYGTIVMKIGALFVIGAGLITNRFVAVGMGDRMAGQLSSLNLGAILADPFGPFDSVGTFLTWTPVAKAVGHFTMGGVGESFADAGGPGGWLVVFWQHVLLAIYLAFALSLLYSLITQVYLLMRKAVDGTPFEEVYIETPEEEAFAAQFAGEPTPATVVAPTIEPEMTEAPAATPKPAVDKPIDLAGDGGEPTATN